MSRRAVIIASMFLVVTLAGARGADEPPDLTAEELARRGTEATAVLNGPTDLLSTAFCVHPDGLFVTTAAALVHPTVGEFPPTVQLTLRPGKPNQSVHVAKVVRWLWNPGLALLKVDGAVGLTAPSFAPPESVEELLGVTAFDIPVRPSLDRRTGPKPALVHISTGSISALQREKTELRRIQFDAPLSPGSTGGLLLDQKARVVGVIMGRVRAQFGAGVGLAVPVNVLDEFLNRVDLSFDPPVLNARNLLETVDFKVGVTEVFPSKRALELELTLGGLGSGAPRHFRMTLAGSHYEAKAAPAAVPLSPATVWLEAMYKDGSVLGQLEDRAIEIAGAGAVWLGELRRLRPGSRVVAQRGDGTTLFGTSVSGLGDTTMTVHNQKLKFDLGQAQLIAVRSPEVFPGLDCSMVARREGREVGRLEATIDPGDRVWPCLEALCAGRFIRPVRSETPITHMALAIGPILPEQPREFEEGEFHVRLRVPENFSRRDPATGKLEPVDRSGFKRGVTITFPGHQRWELVFEAPHYQELEVGVYTVAAEQDMPITSPQIKLATDAYWDPKLSARFAIWEIEVREGVVTRLALDFAGHGRGAFKNRQDFAGIVRYHSKCR